MASNLKAMVEQKHFSGDLTQFGEIVSDFLRSRYREGDHISSTTWRTIHDGKPMVLQQETYNALLRWATQNFIRPFTRNLFLCNKLQRGNVIYQPFTASSGNSCVLFRPRGSNTHLRGRIDTIFQEPESAVPILSVSRIALLVRAFQSLTPSDTELDPYVNHPLVGRSHFGIMALYYDSVDLNNAYIIEPSDIIAHVAVAKYDDPTGRILSACIVTVDLDLVRPFIKISKHI